jgi:hypothetical protein
MSSAVLVQTKGWARLFQPLMEWRILPVRSRTLQKVPRWMAWGSMMENHTSTRFSQDAEVGDFWPLHGRTASGKS